MANNQPIFPPTPVQMTDNIPGLDYSNVMEVRHTEEEFILTFCTVAAPTGRVVAKIVVSPAHLKRIIETLQDNVSKYEKSFGKIKIISGGGEDKSRPLGFQGPKETKKNKKIKIKAENKEEQSIN